MKEVLDTVLELQELNCQLKIKEDRLKAIPQGRRKAEAFLKSRKAEYDAVVARKDEIGSSRRAMEGELSEIEQKVSKYKNQLMTVKTNKEYEALKNEIALFQDRASDLETRILMAMEESDRMAREVEEHNRAFKADQATHDKQMRDLDGEEEALKERVAELKDRIEATEKALDASVLDRYRKIAKVREGIVLARVSDDMCGACHMRIRPQLLAELKKRDHIYTCEACHRIFYWSLSPLPFETIMAGETDQEDGEGRTNGS